MSDQNHEKLRRIFDLVIAAFPEERAAILDRECGDDAELRQRIEAMVEAAEDARFLSAPTELSGDGSVGTIANVPSELPGMHIGPYKLLQQIGEGGFGSVFMAEQERPVQRRVALKIIKLGMDTRQVIARFEQERQALAILDHPNIAKVFDAGATETGRPYFVMELCKGDSIEDYCDKHNLSIDQRLELFAQVCTAVQHAHTKGIIHRDIKPSNVLVSTQDGKPAAKIIDFGIAKATASKLTEKTLFTEHKQLIGTPEYMSPEQAEGSLDIDTRTDVYSLGVMLYELLTGATPFDSKKLRSAAYAEIARIIREEDPPKPSTRISHNTDSIATVAAQRHTEPRKLGTIVRGELDWIVMKALEKDRSRRYETANGLAMDIRRYLAGEAVVAAPPSASYRLRKFVRRNKGVVTASAAVAAALFIGLIGFAWQARIAQSQRDVARVERNRAVAAEGEAKKRADELKQVSDFQAQMLAQVDPTTAGVRLSEDVRKKFDAALLKAGVPDDQRAQQVEAFVSQWSRVNATDASRELIDGTILKPAVVAIDKQFVGQPIVAATLREAVASRYHDLGLDEIALALAQKTLADRRRVLGDDHADTLVTITDVGNFFSALGKYDEALPFFREALERSRRVLGNDNQETLVCIANMGGVLSNKGLFNEAEPYYRQALDARRRLLGDDHPETLLSIRDWATLLQNQGKPAESEIYFRQVLEKSRRVLGEDNRDTFSAVNNLASVLYMQRKYDEAVKYFRQVTERKRRVLGEVHPATLESIANLGNTLAESGHPAEAEALMREALTNERRLLGADHPNTLFALSNLAVFLIDHDKLAEAEPMCREALERRRRVSGENHPDTLVANNVMGFVLRRQNKDAQAEPYVRETLAISKRVLGPTHPDTFLYTHNLAMLTLEQDKLKESEELFTEVVHTGGPAIGIDHPTVLSAVRQLGHLLLDSKRYAQAAEMYAAFEAGARKTYTGEQVTYLAAFLKAEAIARAHLNQFVPGEANLLEAHAILLKAAGPTDEDTTDCVLTLVEFYNFWDKAEPGKGHDATSAEWKSKLPATQPATQPTTQPTTAPATQPATQPTTRPN